MLGSWAAVLGCVYAWLDQLSQDLGLNSKQPIEAVFGHPVMGQSTFLNSKWKKKRFRTTFRLGALVGAELRKIIPSYQ
jgi:hypothetical protein